MVAAAWMFAARTVTLSVMRTEVRNAKMAGLIAGLRFMVDNVPKQWQSGDCPFASSVNDGHGFDCHDMEALP